MFDFQEFDDYLSRLQCHLTSDSNGISFREFFQFSMLLNNIQSFEIASKFYEYSGKSMTRKDFARAAKICLNGQELTDNVLDTVFWLFDKNGTEHFETTLTKHFIVASAFLTTKDIGTVPESTYAPPKTT